MDVLEENNITPIVVLDGKKFDEKIVNKNRSRYDLEVFVIDVVSYSWSVSDNVHFHSTRHENLRIGLQLWNRDKARHFLRQGANVSTKMTLELIEVCNII